MNRRLSIRLPDGLAWGIEALARRSGRTKSEIVRDALAKADIGVPSSIETRREALHRATAARAGQKGMIDTVALIREVRDEMEEDEPPDPPAGRDAVCRGGRKLTPGRATARFQESP